MLDTAQALETPEGVDIELRAAGIVVRGLALLIDLLIQWGILMVFSIVLGVIGTFGMGVFAIVWFAMFWFYGVAFEVLRDGQTPGKRAHGIRVVHDDGTPIRLPASLIRNLLLIVDALPAAYAAGLVTMMVSGSFQRLGDLAAGTRVIYTDAGAPKPDPDAAGSERGSRLPPVPLTLDERRAVVAFADRRGTLSDDRARELAALLAPSLDCTGDEAVGEVLRVANAVKGAGG